MADTDRELLELAAKAAGITFGMETDSGPTYHREAGFYNPDSGRFWNPLTEDDDALRLAVKLGMEVNVDTHPDGCACSEAQSHTYSTPENCMRSIVNHDDDPYAATRRAIVVAAAEIGRSALAGKG